MTQELETARACADRMMRQDRASQTLGITVEIPQPGSAIATLSVREDMLNGFGICHGGIVFALADTAFAFACNAYDDLSVAASGSIDYLAPVQEGDLLTAIATEELREGRRGYYQVNVRNQDNALIAVFRGRSSARGEPLLK